MMDPILDHELAGRLGGASADPGFRPAVLLGRDAHGRPLASARADASARDVLELCIRVAERLALRSECSADPAASAGPGLMAWIASAARPEQVFRKAKALGRELGLPAALADWSDDQAAHVLDILRKTAAQAAEHRGGRS